MILILVVVVPYYFYLLNKFRELRNSRLYIMHLILTLVLMGLSVLADYYYLHDNSWFLSLFPLSMLTQYPLYRLVFRRLMNRELIIHIRGVDITAEETKEELLADTAFSILLLLTSMIIPLIIAGLLK